MLFTVAPVGIKVLSNESNNETFADPQGDVAVLTWPIILRATFIVAPVWLLVVVAWPPLGKNLLLTSFIVVS